jgi:uncharacterized protein YhaN
MTDTTAADGQEPGADTTAQDATTHGNEQDSAPTGFDALPPETQAEIRKLRKEAATYRKKAEEYENLTKTEAERRESALKAAEDRAATLEARLRDLSARSVVTEAATKANALSSRAVYALIQSDLEYDDTGNPTNVDALVKQAIKDEPQLFRASAGSGDGGKGNGQPNTQSLNDLLRVGLGRG